MKNIRAQFMALGLSARYKIIGVLGIVIILAIVLPLTLGGGESNEEYWAKVEQRFKSDAREVIEHEEVEESTPSEINVGDIERIECNVETTGEVEVGCRVEFFLTNEIDHIEFGLENNEITEICSRDICREGHFGG